MTIDLVFITFNRLGYTRLALQSILADPNETFSLSIWDNASTDGTAEYLKNEINDPRIRRIHLSDTNIGQTAAVNAIWSQSKADLLGKLDNDCLVTPGWTQILAQAHRDIEKLGVVACWHFFEDDFDTQRAADKIQTFGPHRIFRHPWTCGTGLLIKNETYRRMGPIDSKAMTKYWLNMAAAGYINGFYYPLIYQEHMDDPKSRYAAIKSEEDFQKARQTTVGLAAGRYDDMEGRFGWRQEIVRNLLDDPYDPAYYTGLGHKLRLIKQKLGIGKKFMEAI
jgi:glycosyltransferase involved in cell wall biosynthesis